MKRLASLVLAAMAFADVAAAQETTLRVPPDLVVAGPAQTHAAGRVRAGDVLLSAPVRYARTGVLKRDASLGKEGKPPPIGMPVFPAGKPVYAVLLGDYLGPKLVWCAPEPLGTKWPKRAGTCFPETGKRLFLGEECRHLELIADKSVAYYVTRLAVPNYASSICRIEVEEKPVDFGVPLTFEITFLRWTLENAEIGARVTWQDGGSASLPIQKLTRYADGTARFEALGRQVLLKRGSGDGKSAEVEITQPGAP